MMLLVACATEVPPGEGWEAAEAWAAQRVSEPEVVADGLDAPAGIVEAGDALLVAEYGGGRVLRIGDGVEELATGLAGPWRIAGDGARAVVSERDGGRVLLVEGGAVTVLAEGLVAPGEVALDGDIAVWIDEGTGSDGALWVADLADPNAAPITTELASPLGLAVEGGFAWVCERGTWRVLRIDLSSGEAEVFAEVAEPPQDVAVSQGVAWFTAYAGGWPHGSWVYRADDDGASAVLTTPPAPSWIALTGDTVVWTGGGVIAAGPADGGDFQTLAVETAVGSLTVLQGDVVWTESQRGEVRRMAGP